MVSSEPSPFLLFTLNRGRPSTSPFLHWITCLSIRTVTHSTILGSTLFLLFVNDLPDDVICNIAIYADDTTLYSKCDQTSDLWQQLALASELESDLRDTVDWVRKWLFDFNAGKTQLV